MKINEHRYFIINKPFNMVSQFISTHEVNLLGKIDYPFPEGTHAIGRLDSHSEGLLVLTTNKKLTRLLFQSKTPHKRTYYVQVSNILNEEKLEKLRTGVTIRIKTGEDYITAPCDVEKIDCPLDLYKLETNFKVYPPYTWISITITEGKYHQVRKMIGALHHRCKRLIRVSIEDLILGNLAPGGVLEMEESTIFKLLKIVD